MQSSKCKRTKILSIKNENKLCKQIEQCQFWYNGASKRFVEFIYWTVATEIEVFSTSLNDGHQRWALLKCLIVFI